ncbi:MAG: hypothetical protein IKI59_02655 [Clostridia bacterium]|nr:hypothetical protein [Clostridia bacterium]
METKQKKGILLDHIHVVFPGLIVFGILAGIFNDLNDLPDIMIWAIYLFPKSILIHP